MLVKDETKYCWRLDDEIGTPQPSIESAIDEYIEDHEGFDYECNRYSVNIFTDEVEIGHPYYYVPEVDGERVIYDVLDNDLPEEFAECDFQYFKKVKKEHLCELSKELTDVFRKWEKIHGYGYGDRVYTVLETKKYRIVNYV